MSHQISGILAARSRIDEEQQRLRLQCACLVVLRLLDVDGDAQLAAARNRGGNQIEHLLKLRNPVQRQQL